MLNQFSFHAIIGTTVLLSCLVAWIVLKLICLSGKNRFSFLYISSGKSSTNARLLGGLGISSAIIFTLIDLLVFYRRAMTETEVKLLSASLLSVVMVTIYGYVDDKFEVRVRFKLLMQIASIGSFAYLSAKTISHAHPWIELEFACIFGLALLNGTNLLDGLDTLMVKLGGVSTLGFLCLGIYAHSIPAIVLSSSMLSALAVFYFFNKEPAKVYMGEIGGALIGLVFFMLSTFVFNSLKFQMGHLKAFSLIGIACSFPVCELGISFMRRLWGKKSPFRGDRLHLHYVLKNRYQLSASAVATNLGAAGACALIFGFALVSYVHPAIAFFSVTFLIVTAYTMICLPEWKTNYYSEMTSHFSRIFEGRKINILDSTKLNDLAVSVDVEPSVMEKKQSA